MSTKIKIGVDTVRRKRRLAKMQLAVASVKRKAAFVVNKPAAPYPVKRLVVFDYADFNLGVEQIFAAFKLAPNAIALPVYPIGNPCKTAFAVDSRNIAEDIH